MFPTPPAPPYQTYRTRTKTSAQPEPPVTRTDVPPVTLPPAPVSQATTPPAFHIDVNSSSPQTSGRGHHHRQKSNQTIVILACVAGAVLFGIVLLSVVANSPSLLGGPVSAARMKAQVRRDLAAQNSGARVYITQWSDVLYDTPAEWDIPQYGIRTGDKVDAILVDYKPAGQQSFAPFTGEELVTRVLYYFHRGKIVSRRGGIIPASTPIYIP